MGEEARKKRHIAIGRDGQVQIGGFGAIGAPGIDHHDPQIGPGFPGRENALIENRVAPGEIGSDQYDQIGQFEILIGPRNGVGSKGALVPGNRGCHAKP